MGAIGIQTVFGLGEETVYGTAVTPTRFLPIISEGMKQAKDQLDDPSLYPGSYQATRNLNRVTTGRSAAGDVKLGVRTKSMGLLFKHIMGALSAPVITNPGAGAYLHTYTPGLSKGKSLTLQKQLRDNAGTVVGAWDYSGSKITKAEFTIDAKGVLQLGMSVDSQNEAVQGSPATASYGTGRLFHFQQALVKLAGTQVTDTVPSASITIERPMDTDAIGIGNQGLKTEPAENDNLMIGGKLSSRFENIATAYNRFDADTEFALILEFTTSTVLAVGYPERLRFTIPAVHFNGETPTVGGPGAVSHDIPFTGYYDGTNPSITIEYQTGDATS